MITIKQNVNVYEIRFQYDEHLVYLIKQVPGRQWRPNGKYWEIPLDKLGFFYSQIKGTPYMDEVTLISDEHINENDSLDVTTHIPNIDISGVPFYVKEGATPYTHQLDFMKYAIDKENRGYMSGFLLCDEQGLAKSAESMNLAIYNRYRYGFKRCLIICCVNSAKYHWREDIIDHSRGAFVPYILGTRYGKRTKRERSDTGNAERLKDLTTLRVQGEESNSALPYFIIMNVEAIRNREGKKYPIADMLIKLIQNHEINMVVIDEVHRNLSPSSTQGKQLLRIKKQTGTLAQWIPVTGTPIVNKPTDIFLPLRLIDAHNHNSYYTWSQEYCIYGGFGGHEIIGYKNIPDLKRILQDNMIRRLKDNVLDLPPKIPYTEYVDNTPYQCKLYDSIADELKNNRDEIVSSLNPLSYFLKLRQVNGSPELIEPKIRKYIDNADLKSYLKYNAKLKDLLDLLSEIHERKEKVVIFSNWVEPLRTIYKFIRTEYNTCVFTGTMNESDRQKNKQRFIQNPKYTIMLGTIGAMGTVHTFTCANNVIFYDSPWNMVDYDQASDRCHRIGTTKTVNVYKLISRNTVDERVDNILFRKGGISNFIVDNIDIHSNPELFDLLLGYDKPQC